MKSFLFRFRFAYKNIIKNPGRSFVVCLTLILAMALLTLILSLSSGFSQMFTYQFSEPYINVDMTLTYDSNSEARIVNKRRITEEYSDYYNFAACFFNYYSLTTAGEETFYSQVFSASIVDLENVIDINLNTLDQGEVFITSSLAEKYQLSVGDSISIFVADNELVLRIKAILEDRGLFKGDALFVDKVALMEWLYTFPGMANMGNIIYFDVKDSADPEEFQAALEADPEYDDFVVEQVVNVETIHTMTSNTAALFIGVGAVTLIALLLVLNSLFPLLFEDFRQQIGIIHILGGSPGFSLSIWALQFALYSVVAIPLGLTAAASILNGAAETIGVTTEIVIGSTNSLMSILAFLVFLGAEIWIRYSRMIRKSAVALSYDHRHEVVGPGFILMVVSFVLLVAQLIFQPFPEEIDALLNLILGILFSFTFIDVLSNLAGSVFSHRKTPTVFGLFGAKNLKSNRIIRNSIKVAMISIVVIVLNLTIRAFTIQESIDTDHSFEADYFLANIVDDTEVVKADILAKYDVESVEEAIVYQNVYMNFSEEDPSERRKAAFFFSLPYDRIDDYFNFDFEQGIAEKFADTQTPYIALAVGLGKIYGIEVGDTITVEISREIPQMTFVVAGFIQTNYLAIAFSNLSSLDAYHDAGLKNTLLINATGDEGVKIDLMKAYSARMYYLIDTDEMLGRAMEQLNLIMDFVSFLAYAVALAFIVVIINNSLLMFYSLKTDFARMMVLGLSRREISWQMVREVLLMTGLATIGSFVCLVIVIPTIGPLMLLAHYYKLLEVDALMTLGRTLVGALVFLLSYGFYLQKIHALDLIQEIKTY